MKKRKTYIFPIFILNLINVGPFTKALEPEKKSELINIGPMFISESRVYKSSKDC